MSGHSPCTVKYSMSEPERIQRELELQLGLTDALQMARGFGAPETMAQPTEPRSWANCSATPVSACALLQPVGQRH
jgi:hypothetical protein